MLRCEYILLEVIIKINKIDLLILYQNVKKNLLDLSRWIKSQKVKRENRNLNRK